jgi:uncharacterized protein YhbP (UPF0306 family)
MDKKQIEHIIREYIEQVVHMSLGTSSNNRPWVCEVHFAVDDELNIYFRSTTNRRHCQDIAENPLVAGNIVTQHFKNQRVRGVYFEGEAELLGDVDEEHDAYLATAKRFGEASKIQAVSAEDDTPRYYKITVKNWYLFDSYGPAPVDKYHLPWKKA